MEDVYGAEYSEFSRVYSTITVQYARENCSALANSTTDVARIESTVDLPYPEFKDGQCAMGDAVYCMLEDGGPPQCRLNVRMNAAFVLMVCLVFKAGYMVAVNISARGKLKTQCLTFGDVIIASASNPELRVQGYVLVFEERM
jgi:hypothetical protein